MSANEQSKTMLQAISEMPSDKEKIAQGSLPGGCLFHLETASKYTDNALNAESLDDCLDALRVVREQLDEIKEKVRKAGK